MLKRLLRVGVTLLLVALVISGLFFLSPDRFSEKARNYVATRVESELFDMRDRARRGQSTLNDRQRVSILISIGTTIFKPLYPEATEILSHYADGGGEKLTLDPSYIRRSPVVREAIGRSDLIAQLPFFSENVVGPRGFSPNEDYRLALALNPFMLKRRTLSGGVTEYIVYQQIDFSHPNESRDIWTPIGLGRFSFRFPDELIHLVDPKPFYVEARWVE